MKRWIVVIAALLTSGILAPAQSALIDTRQEFNRANNEGGISIGTFEFSRGRISGGALDSWQFTRLITPRRQGHSAVAYNGFLYAIGGTDPDGAAVNVASIRTDGHLNAFTATTSLPAPRQQHFTVAYNGYAYVIGGRADPTSSSDQSLFAKLNDDGSVGAWTSTESLPAPREWGGSAVYNGHIYLVGGTSATTGALGTVLTAAVKADGSIGPWTDATSLPEARYSHASFAYNGFLYAVGGFTEDAAEQADEVLVAPINSDGSLGAWTKTTSMPERRGFGPCVAAHDGFVYVWQGFAGTFPMPQGVMVGSLNADGTVGSWTNTEPLPVVRLSGAAAVWNGFLYSVGGSDGDFGGEVIFAKIKSDSGNANQDPSKLRAVYSQLIDLKTESPNMILKLTVAQAPGCRIRVQVRRAPESTAVFGAETVIDPAPINTDIPLPGHERWLWIRLTLDDTGTSDVDKPTTVYTISVNRPPVANAGPDQELECFRHDGRGVILDGTGSTDPDGDALQYFWQGSFGSIFGPTPAIGLPLGTHEITLTVSDAAGYSSTDTVTIKIVDTTPPNAFLTRATPDTLWAPNKRMKAVTLNVSQTDLCDMNPHGEILSVASNQPAGSEPDWEITGDLSLNLRAERTSGKTRIYTITVRVTDASGNSSTGLVQVTVAKN